MGNAEREADERREMVNHPRHYNGHASGVEAVAIIEEMNFNIGTAIKYLWREGLKFDDVEDLKKARWYIDREIRRRERKKECGNQPLYVINPDLTIKPT